MGRKSESRAVSGLLVGKVDDVIESDGKVNGRPLVITGRRSWREVVRAKPGAAIASVRDNMLRIQEQADPIGFLIEVMNGSMFPVQFVDDDGNIVQHYVTPDMGTRIKIAQFMANKVLPTLSVTKHVLDVPPENGDAAYIPNAPGQPNFAQIVKMAAMRRRAGGGSVPVPVEAQIDDDPAYHMEISDDSPDGPDGSGSAEGS